MRQSCNLCYGIWMKCYRRNLNGFLWAALVSMSLSSGMGRAQTSPAQQTPAASAQSKAQADKPKTEKLESIQEHFEGKKDTRGFPMNLLPLHTNSTLVWSALGIGVASSLLIVGGGSIAIVNYESQSRPEVSPQDRLSARAAGRVGLGIAAVGIASLFLPPLLIDLALPEPKVETLKEEASMTPDPKINKEVTGSASKEKTDPNPTNTDASAPSSIAPTVKVKKQ